MSFGFSVGDFIAVIELCYRIRKDFVAAPAQFEAISDEVRSLSIVVQDVEIDLSSTVLGNKQRAELQEIMDGCRNVLMGIEKAVNNYVELKHDQGMERNVVKRVWKQFKWEPDDINSLRSRLNSNIVLLSAFNGHITGNNVTKLVKYQDSQEYRTILDWLSPVSAFATRQNDCKSRREAGTSQWFLDCPGFSAWILKPNQTLFCPGIPGAGKTILISAVIEELYSRFGRNNANGIAYIYCDYKNLEEQKPEKLLACLLRQLLHGQQTMPQSLRTLYHQHIGIGTRPSLDEISGAIQSVSAKLLRLFIVIDALDECQNSDGSRTAFLDEIFSLQAKSTLNILATSRFIPEIAKMFESEPSLEIRASKDDVTKYLRGHMTRLPSFVLRSPELQDEIVLGITETADGSFLLAQLHFQSLIGKKSRRAMRSTLQNAFARSRTCDSPYDTVYEEVMKRIEGQVPDQSQVAQQALAWITFAKRQITTLELQNALAVEAGDLEFDTENLADLEDIISACQGLITLDEGSDIIRLVHYTAQEYLQRVCDTWFPNAHDEIASICLTYLSFDAFKAGPCSTDQEFETRLSQYPLYYYAAENWGLHIPMRSMHETTLLSFLTDIPKLDASVQGLWAHEEYMKHPGYSQRAAKEVTGSHLAAYFGLEGVILELLGRGNPIDSKDSRGRTPLSWAAQNAHESVVELLLRKGVDSNSRDNEGLSPISWAAISGQEAIIKLLLEKGVDPDAKHNDGRTPLSWAAYRGHHAVVKILLGNGANPDSRDENDITPLSLAAFSGRKSVVKLLLEANVNPDSKNRLGRTALSQAAYSGHVAIVRMLLEKGADPRLEDVNGQSPLSRASGKVYEAVIKLLTAYTTS